MQTCPVCKQNIPDGVFVCPACRTPLADTPVVALCRVCGGPLDPMTHHCPRCEAGKTAAPAVPVPGPGDANVVALCRVCGSPLDPETHVCPVCGGRGTAKKKTSTRQTPPENGGNIPPKRVQTQPNGPVPGPTAPGAPAQPRRGSTRQPVPPQPPVARPARKKSPVPLYATLAVVIILALAVGVYFAVRGSSETDGGDVPQTAATAATRAPETAATAQTAAPQETEEATTATPQPQDFGYGRFHITLTDAFVSEMAEPGADGTHLMEIYTGAKSRPDVRIMVRCNFFGANGWEQSDDLGEFAAELTSADGYTVDNRVTRADGSILYYLTYTDGAYTEKLLLPFYKASDGFWFLDIQTSAAYYSEHENELLQYVSSIRFD